MLIPRIPDPLTVAKGGTGAADAATARTNLGLAIGSDVQEWSQQLDDLALPTGTGILERPGSVAGPTGNADCATQGGQNAVLRAPDGSKTFVFYLSSDWYVYGAEYDHTRRKWGTPVQIAAAKAADNHNYPSAILLSDGRILLAFGSHDTAQYLITSTSPYDISAWDAERTLGTWCTYPSFAKDSGGNIYLLLRTDNPQNAARYLTLYKSADDGETWSDTTLVDTGAGNVWAYPAKLAVGPDDKIHVAWCRRTSGGQNNPNEFDDIYYMRSADGGATWTESDGTAYVLPVTPLTAEAVRVANKLLPDMIAVEADGTPVISYIEAVTEAYWTVTEVHHARPTGGGAWVDRELPHADWVLHGQLAIDAAGTWHAFASRPVAGTREVIYLTSDDQGQAWTEAQVTSASATHQDQAVINPNTALGVEIVWHDATSGEIQYALDGQQVSDGPVRLLPAGAAAAALLAAETAAAQRTALGLGTIATQNSPLPFGGGGVAAASLPAARANLGVRASVPLPLGRPRTLDVAAGDADRKGFRGGFTDGTWGYLVPGNTGADHGKFTRFLLSDFATVEALDLTGTDPDLKGFVGGCTDGRYAYLAPGAVTGKVARVDLNDFTTVDVLDLATAVKKLAFTSGGTYVIAPGDTATNNGQTAAVVGVEVTSGTWAGGDAAGNLYLQSPSGAFAAGQIDVGANLDVATASGDYADSDLRGYLSGAVDQNYLYLCPHDNGSKHGKLTRISLSDFATVAVLDLPTAAADAALVGFRGIVVTGSYVYLVPFNSGAESGKIPRVALSNFVTVQVVDLTELHPNCKGYWGGCWDGKFLYLAPYFDGADSNGRVVRLDESVWSKDQAYQIQLKDINVNWAGYWGCCTDGRYLYLAPGLRGATRHGNLVRIDLHDWSATGVQCMDLATVDADLKGFYGAFTDGRHVYLVPNYDGAAYQGVVARIQALPGGNL